MAQQSLDWKNLLNLQAWIKVKLFEIFTILYVLGETFTNTLNLLRNSQQNWSNVKICPKLKLA